MTGDAIARALALPCWHAPSHAQALPGGITNQNIRVTDAGRDYVVRLGGDIPEHMVLRWNELSVARAAASAGLGPGVHHHEPGALVIDYIPARALSEADLHEEATLLAATDLVARMHRDVAGHLRGPVLTFWVFHILRDYAATLRDRGSPHAPRLGDLLDAASALERAVGPVDLVIGHNDLLPANILHEGSRLWLIDFEYAGFNSPLFDLGGLATNAGLERAAETAMLARYFGRPPDAGLLRRYDAMKCASLLRETMWSMVSELTSTLDFDYGSYTASNLARFEAAHARFLQEHP